MTAMAVVCFRHGIDQQRRVSHEQRNLDVLSSGLIDFDLAIILDQLKRTSDLWVENS